MRRLLLPALLLASACQKQPEAPTPAPATPPAAPAPAPVPAPAPKPAEAAPAPSSDITTMVDVMKRRLSPFVKGESTDEVAFRYALGQLRELAPPDSNYNQGQRPWFQIVDDMLSSHDYKRGCQECHRLYKKDYERNYGDGSVVWVDPPGGAR